MITLGNIYAADGISQEAKRHIRHLKMLNKHERRAYFRSLPFELRQELKQIKKRRHHRGKKFAKKLRSMTLMQRKAFFSRLHPKKKARLKRVIRRMKAMKFKERQRRWKKLSAQKQQKYIIMNDELVNMEPHVRLEAISKLSETDQENLSLMQPEANEASVFSDVKEL